ncbi:unnamed protein product [Eruca vesicaria subsp. sativa]|uniref:TFIIS central domain-containing protein n=1 Tax=Eruca vesicaria subsp. sativa TaxID=29727 RepID=A0ABC8ILB2_ERUVS|nr:unnamed protein product [Eruca vesicaria subsp. sativa]
MEMAELGRSMQLAGKGSSPPEATLSGTATEAPNKQFRPWLQPLSPASNGILHIPTNALSQKTLNSLMHGKNVTLMDSGIQKPGNHLNPLMHGKNVTLMDSAPQKPGNHVNPLMHGKNVALMDSAPQRPANHIVNKKQQIPPRGSVKPMHDVNETVRSKMRESLASALALVQQHDGSPKGEENVKSGETPVVNPESTQSFQPAPPASFSVPVGGGTMSEFPTDAERSVQKDGEIPGDIRMEDVNQSDGLKSQFDEVFPRDEVPFTDNIFSNDDLLQGNELSWVLDNVSDLDETDGFGINGEKSFEDPEILASKIEMELFKLFGGVNKKYREKGRSLLFNLKDKNNPELRERVMSGAISPERLCSMTAEELASKELSEWRQAKAEKMAEMVVLRDTDIDVRRLVRKTHKGEFQVEIDPVDSGMVDVSAGITSRSRRRPKPKTNSAETTLNDKTANTDQTTSRDTPPSTEEIDPMQGLAMDDELKDVEFLPPIVSLDEFMESLDSEPPFESPHGNNSELQVSASEKSDSEIRPHSKSPKGSPKEISDKDSPKPNPEKIDEVSPKPDVSIKLDDDISGLEKTPSPVDVKGEKVWHGLLQLSMSSVVPVTGIFRSGEKADTSEWPAMVEVKGRVRLSGFGKFIQELPKSRSRTLMVMYLACKDGISKSQRGSLFEVVDSYVADKRVGYAEPASGVELYLCPTRGETLDLLTKVISKDQLDEIKSLDSGLLAVVVWRRPTVHKPSLKRQHSYASSGSGTSALSESKKQRGNLTENKPLVVASVGNHHHGYAGKAVEEDDDDDDAPPGFGPVASRDDDDLPEFNFCSSAVPVSSHQPLPSSQTKSLDQVRKLIHMYGNSASSYDDDDIPEWQPNVPSHQLPPPPPPPPGFRPEMSVQDQSRTMVRPSQDGWWDNQNGGTGQHYDHNGSRNRGF